MCIEALYIDLVHFLLFKKWHDWKKYALVELEHVESWQTSKMIVLLGGTS